eukprot:GHVU01018143.1.p2 GENE.GHVU01018143.1~~GHVU01018143.1.p2  ORF type:complete len:107 (-),score=6.76 GHVU01018143.1:112-432(-)
MQPTSADCDRVRERTHVHTRTHTHKYALTYAHTYAHPPAGSGPADSRASSTAAAATVLAAVQQLRQPRVGVGSPPASQGRSVGRPGHILTTAIRMHGWMDACMQPS